MQLVFSSKSAQSLLQHRRSHRPLCHYSSVQTSISRFLLVPHSPFLQSKFPFVSQGNKLANLLKDADTRSRLPSDPFVYHAPDSDETVRFYSYGISLPRKDVTHAIVFATRAIAMHGSSEEGISDRIIRYGSNDVYLLMHHSGRMTWTMWETALRGIVDFLERYEYVEVEFDIGQTGLEQFLGTGVLGMKKG